MADSDEKIQITNYSFFPGCVIQNRIPFIEKSARFVFDKLGISLTDQAFGCCPDPVGVQSTNMESWLVLGARNLVLSENAKLPIVSMCNGCSETLKSVKYELDHHEEEKKRVNIALANVGKEYQGDVQVLHFVEVLAQNLDKIEELVVKPFVGQKIALHVGCHYARPSESLQTDDPLDPKLPKKILEAIGFEVVEYDEANLCCGSSVARNDELTANGLLKRKFESIMTTDATMVSVNCPSCFQQLEAGQRAIKKDYNLDPSLPIMYITELVALAFGASMDDLGLKFHAVKPMKDLKAIGFE